MPSVHLDNTIRGIFSFRILPAMYLCLKHIEVSGGPPEKGSMHRLWVELLQALGNPKEDLTLALLQMKNTIYYAYWDFCMVYSSLEQGLEKFLPNTHYMPPDILENYVLSMGELHQATEWNIDLLIPYMKDKRILDLGCGSGFFEHIISGISEETKYIGIDRVEILSILSSLDSAPNSRFLTEEEFNGINDANVLFLSEVLHSKNHPLIFMDKLAKIHLEKDGNIVIISLLPNTSRSLLFDMQLMLHSGNMNRNVNSYGIPPERVIATFQVSDFHLATVVKHK